MCTEVIFALRNVLSINWFPSPGPVALGFAQMMNEHVSNFMDELGAKNNSKKNASVHIPPVVQCKKNLRFLLCVDV